MRSDDLYTLPPDLPVPVDDGACRHLIGLAIPPVALASTADRLVRLDEPYSGATVIFCYPRMGRPDQDPLGGWEVWNAIPGARGCTPQACAYRDHYLQLQTLQARVFGVSTQAAADQREAVERLRLPFELLSDAELTLTRALSLPSFEHAGLTLLKRLTLIVEGGRIAVCFYPVFPSSADAPRALTWLRAHMT
jgi:peroxiredoxin